MSAPLPRVLCVDDEPNVLSGLSRQLRRHFEIATATSGAEGLERLAAESGGFAVIVSDMRMPGMDGATFLHRSQSIAPDATRVLLTGQADLNAAIVAVNEGQIFRFLTKPCPTDRMIMALDAAVRLHRLTTAEHELLQRTLRGSVDALAEVLSLAKPAIFGRAIRVKRRCEALAEALGLEDRWEIHVAAVLSQIGGVTLPDDVAEKLGEGLALSADETAMVERLPELTDRLLAHIPRLEGVREILAAVHARPADAPLGAKILAVAEDWDELETRQVAPKDAISDLMHRTDRLDPRVIEALEHIITSENERTSVREVDVGGLAVGMILADDVQSISGMLLLARGTEVTLPLLSRLRNVSSRIKIRQPLRVRDSRA